MTTTDQHHIWHPYSALFSEQSVYCVESAHGVRLRLDDGRELIDGMSSWWCVIHGYNHPAMNAALSAQMHKMSHVMFGGLTHAPAIELTEQLLNIVPTGLQSVFYSDSGSVAVDVALKMAVQYWHAQGQPRRQRFVSLRCGYHGDTIGAMSVCDPDTGMHGLFRDVLQQNIFAPQPRCRFGEPCSSQDIQQLTEILETQSDTIAAIILEPIVQGAGGMWFYSADYLARVRELCTRFGVLLIADEIATGFGRTGTLFACEHANISPDILCIGKALTGGYLTLAATLTTREVSDTIDRGQPGVFMHGPTFMANPLACTVASTSIQLLLDSPWQANIARIERALEHGLAPCRRLDNVQEVRVLGAIGVVEMKQVVDMKNITRAFVDAGVWVRPFGKLVYLMPPYVINGDDLEKLTQTVAAVIAKTG